MAAEGISRTCFYLLISEAVTGIATSLFIMWAIFMEVSIGVDMRTKDKILLPLSFSHTVFTVLMLVNVCHKFFLLSLTIYMRSLIAILSSYCIWSGTSLTLSMCFFHFFKLVQFRSSLLSLVKMKVDILIPWMIVVVVVASLCGSVLNVLLSNDIQQGPSFNSSVSPPSNMTGENSLLMIFFQMYLENFDWLLLVIFFTALTMASIACHVYRMGKSPSSGNSNVKALKVVKSESSFLLFYIIFSVVMAVIMAERIYIQHLGECIYDVFLFAFPTLHCVLIILSNPRYKKSFSSACMGVRTRATKS